MKTCPSCGCIFGIGQQAKLLKYLRSVSTETGTGTDTGTFEVSKVAKATKVDHRIVSAMLIRLTDEGLVERLYRGVYKLTKTAKKVLV